MSSKNHSIAKIYAFEPKMKIERPLFSDSVSAGFPSPAEGYADEALDLNVALMQNPDATFFVKVSGDSMIAAGIHHNDILVVDQLLPPTNGKVVIAVVDGDVTVKQFYQEGGKMYLKAANPNYKSIEITEDTQFEICGVATTVLHHL